MAEIDPDAPPGAADRDAGPGKRIYAHGSPGTFEIDYERRGKPRTRYRQKLPADVGAYDVQSALCMLRSWRAEEGDEASVYVLAGKRLWHNAVRVSGRETIRTSLGRYPTLRIDGVARRYTGGLQLDYAPVGATHERVGSTLCPDQGTSSSTRNRSSSLADSPGSAAPSSLAGRHAGPPHRIESIDCRSWDSHEGTPMTAHAMAISRTPMTTVYANAMPHWLLRTRPPALSGEDPQTTRLGRG